MLVRRSGQPAFPEIVQAIKPGLIPQGSDRVRQAPVAELRSGRDGNRDRTRETR
jgi:hypothetical protein